MKYQLLCAIWEFTLNCNLNCTHCGSAAGKLRPNELDTKESFKLCEGLAELGCQEVCLMGGEPFLRKDWLSVSQCIKDLGINLTYVSNGTILEANLDKIVRVAPKVIGISLDGMKKNHEAIRGEGTWKKAIKSINLLRKKGIQTTIITTLSKVNFKDVLKMKDLLLKKGVNWQIQVAMPFGNFQKEQMLSEEEFYASALFIAKERINNPFQDLPVVGAHCYGYFSKILPGSEWKGCTAGLSSVGITSDGGIVGCLSMGNDRFIEGNVRDKKFKEIWENQGNFSYNRRFDVSKIGPNCIDCKYIRRCRGGCTSVSHSLTKRFHNDPYCFRAIENKIIKI